MSTQALVDKFRWLRSEVLALKQSDTKPLGSANFYMQATSGLYTFQDSSYTLNITVQFGSDVDETPFTQVYFSNSSYFTSFAETWDSDSKTLGLIYSISRGGFSLDIDTKVIASKPIENLAVEAVSKWA